MNAGLYISKVRGRGRGVFSGRKLGKDELIETCPLLILPPEDFPLVTATVLNEYCFLWDKESGKLCLALGFASLYNHSCPSNANYTMDPETLLMEIFAVRPIAAHEEITINYNGDPFNPSLDWFKEKGIPYK